MRLSPKSIFFGLVAFGLPVAVTIGWTVASPTRPPAQVGAPGGAGALGAAPARDGAGRPNTTVRYATSPTHTPPPPTPLRPESVAVIPPRTTAPAPTAPTAPPSATPSESTDLELTMPPVPTPTDPDEPYDPVESIPTLTPPSSAPDPTTGP